jgi:photosystem II stability/assembly factor-like uncharacterized protein
MMPICLSANGDVVTQSDEPPRAMLVATAGGLVHLARDGVGRPWRVTGTALADTHPSALVADRATGTIYCGQHYTGGVLKSADAGTTWAPAGEGLASGPV